MNWADARAFVADFLRFDRGRVMATCLLVVVGGLIEGLGIVLVVPMLEVVGGPGGTGTEARTTLAVFAALGVSGRLGRIALVLAAVALVMVARSVLLARRQMAIASLEVDYLRAKQIGLIRTLGSAPWTTVSQLRHARVTHLLSNDVFRIGQAATGLLQSIVASIMLAIQLTIALWLNLPLTLIAIALLGVSGLAALGILRAAHTLGDMVIGANLTLLNDAGQFLGALKLAVSQNLQGRFVADFESALASVSRAEIDFVRRQNRIRQRLTIVASMAGAGTAFIGFGVLAIAPATVLVLLLILSRMSGPATQLQGQAIELVRSVPAFRHLQALERELFAGEAPVAARPLPPPGDIVFDRVSYAHGDASTASPGAGLRDFSLTIADGSFLGIAGPSGAGKTTFADLLVGLYPPQRGVLRVSGNVVDLAATPPWRDALAYVSQDSFLKHDTIRANLAWGSLRPFDDAALARALATTGADAVIARLPEGLETIVGERGSLISGGERQRLAIARALLREPRLLILDEATNAIDVAGERVLLDRLDAIRPAVTIVMIAHRLESLSRCSSVAIVEAGSVVAQGSFDALKARLADVDLRP